MKQPRRPLGGLASAGRRAWRSECAFCVWSLSQHSVTNGPCPCAMPDIFIYSREPLGEARQGLEDDLDGLLAGAGECTGGGCGERGWNIDLDVFDLATTDSWVERIIDYLRKRPVPRDTYVTVWWSPERQRKIYVFEDHEET